MQKDSIQHDAEVVLRSSDGATFHCWRALLSFASPLFSDMFNLPQPDTSNNIDERDNELAVVDLAEDGCTLSHIVSLCHPPSFTGKLFKTDSVRELAAVLEALTKYEMEDLRGVAFRQLPDPLFLCKDPLKIYALACRYQCHDAARLAAKHTLVLPALKQEYVPDLEKIHAGELYCLILYRDACVAAACSLTEDHTWIMYRRFSALFGCGEETWTSVRCLPSRKYPSGRLETTTVYGWWMEYMKKSRQALQKSPRGDTVKDEELVEDIFWTISSSKSGQSSGLHVWKAFQSFVDAFAEKIDSQVAEAFHLSHILVEGQAKYPSCRLRSILESKDSYHRGLHFQGPFDLSHL